MIGLQVPNPGFAYVRQRSVLQLFRLSNRLAWVAIGLDQTQSAPRVTRCSVLWISAILEETASVLLFGQRHNRRKADFEEEDENTGNMKNVDVP